MRFINFFEDVKLQNDKAFIQEVAMNRLVAEETMLLEHYNKAKDKLNDILKYQ